MTPQEHTPGPSGALSLYLSDWSPRGVRKTWDRCGMSVGSTKRLLGKWGDRIESEMVESVAWFDEEGVLRVCVADYANGRRIVVRVGKRGWKISYERAAIRQAHPTQPEGREG